MAQCFSKFWKGNKKVGVQFEIGWNQEEKAAVPLPSKTERSKHGMTEGSHQEVSKGNVCSPSHNI